MKFLLTIAAAVTLLQVSAQKREEGFDYSFKPTDGVPRYYVITEKKDSGWERNAYYIPENSLAMTGRYSDEEAKVPDGVFTWYHSNRFPERTGKYVNGKKHGAWLRYNEEGILVDSSNYENGMHKGISLGWYPDGMPTDSTNFDGKGNGVVVEWYQSGAVKSAGRMVADTSRTGIWNYFHENGTTMAKERYENGELVSCDCYTESGKQLTADDCKEQDAAFTGGEKGWVKFVERNLNPNIPVNKGAPAGMYTVVIRFIVDTDGQLMDVKPITKFGYGMEEEAIRMLKKAPGWVPAQQHGRKVKAYRQQPITFVVSNG